MTNRLLLFFFILGLAGSIFLQNAHDRNHDYFGEKDIFLALPPGKTLRIASFGFDNLVADSLYIWAIQLYSSYHLQNRYDYIEHIFNTITDISPHYIDPYSIGAMIMGEEAGDFQMAIRLLEKGIANNPQNWILLHDAGFFAQKGLKNYIKAADYYGRAAQIPTAPPLMKRLQAHWTYMQDNLDEAWKMWMEIYTSSTEYQAKRSAFNHLFQIKSDRDTTLLNQKITEYKALKRHLPSSLDDLVREGLLKTIPNDFSGSPYEYDRPTGTVHPKLNFRWKKNF